MSIADVIADLRRDSGFMANVTAWETLPARAGCLVDIPAGLHPALASALHRRGIQQLYSHQAEAIALALGGHNIAVVTPTASGKTLCYTLPALHALLNDANATALYLFPTKALAHDQLADIGDWAQEYPERLQYAAYDGDTPSAQRRSIRQNARLVLTNPDMLHAAILPYHGGWARFLAGLRYVIIDEMHSYRGVFGSHVANVLRRLRRVAAHYGMKAAPGTQRRDAKAQRREGQSPNRPQFLLTSATIANPKQLAEILTERPVQVIDRNGAPQGEKHILLYAPPLYDPVRGLRRSSLLESQELAVRFLLGGLQTIVFGRARLTVELLLSYIRERLRRLPFAPLSSRGAFNHFPSEGWAQGESGEGMGERKVVLRATVGRDKERTKTEQRIQMAIRGYRGGYLPQERRQIEAGLRAGTVRGVVATNALELGIDIGQLEAALICGYPGTIAGVWQQWGRAGRTTETSLAALVATAGALDQFIVNHPQFLLDRSPEHAFANADNLMLLVDQIRCAAFELPFVEGEMFGQSPFTADVLELLAEEGAVQRFGDRFLWSGASYPARQFSLRSVGGDPVVIQTGGAADRSESVGQARRLGRQTDSDYPDDQNKDGPFTIIGEVDAASAPFLAHEGAVYIHEGRSYLVERLDLDEHLAWVWPADVEFYTEASAETEIQALSVQESRVAGGAQLGYGEILVTSQVTQYRRVRRFTHENLGVLPLDYPPNTLDTAGYWLEVTAEAQIALMQAGDWRDAPNDYGPNWQEQRAKARARDGYRCVECGAPETCGRQHDVHHLIPFRAFGYIPGLNENDRHANRLSNLMLLCRRCHQRLEAGAHARTGLDGLAYALGNLAPLHLMCDRRDIGVAVIREGMGGPRIYIYERIPAGIGFSAQMYERHDDLIAGAADLIRGCACHYGCPACVGPVLLVDDEQRPVLETKRLTLALLTAVASEQ